MNRLQSLVSLLAFGILTLGILPARGGVRDISINSEYLKRVVNVHIWIPDSLEVRFHTARDLPALFLLDGGSAFESRSPLEGKCVELESSLSRLVSEKKIPELVVVAVEEDRRGEREPSRRDEFLFMQDSYFRAKPGELRGEMLQYFFDLELFPRIYEAFPISKDRSKIGLGGLSYSAVAAFYLQKSLTSRFGLLLLESASYEVGEGALLRDSKNLFPPPLRCYVGVGTNEMGFDESNRWFNQAFVDGAKLFSSNLREGVIPCEVKLEIGEKEIHEFVSWKRRYPIGIEFLYTPLLSPASVATR
jgi:predicted alpha/beta superfamily hydrolase